MASHHDISLSMPAKTHAARWALIERMYQDHVVAVWQFIAQRLNNDSHAADEVTSAVFLAVTENIASYDPSQAAAGAWVFSIARHKLADHLRRQYREQKRNQLYLNQTQDEFEDAIPITEAQENLLPVRRVLAKMPAIERDALIWKYCDKASTRVIAERLGRTEKACENLLARARQRFRAAMSYQQKGEPRHVAS